MPDVAILDVKLDTRKTKSLEKNQKNSEKIEDQNAFTSLPDSKETKIQDNQLVTSGGRVFCATGTGADLATAQKNAYNLVSKISFEGAVNRKDIGNKGIS